MEAVKDVLTPMRDEFLEQFGEWCGEAPVVLADAKAFTQWADQGPTLYDTAQALGLDTAKVVRSIGGRTPAAGRVRHPSRATGRRAQRRTGGGTRGNGGGPTTEQVLGALQEMGGANQSQLAERFSCSRQTIANRIRTLEHEGQIRRHGSGSQMTWRAKELAPA